MMKKWLFLLVLSGTVACAGENSMVLQYTGVKVKEHNKTYMIERNQPSACLDIPVLPENLYGNKEDVNTSGCKKSVYFSLGTIQPMKLDPKIKTVGELEVLEFIKKAQRSPDRYILVDSRKAFWYHYLTIPTAVNIPYDEIAYDSDFPEERVRLLQLLHVQQKAKRYDFSGAKTVLLFCNGAWCEQSPRAIGALVGMGYPKNKLLWYRGGLQDWLLMGFPGIKP